MQHNKTKNLKKPKKKNSERLSKENSWSKNKIFNLRVDTSHTIYCVGSSSTKESQTQNPPGPVLPLVIRDGR